MNLTGLYLLSKNSPTVLGAPANDVKSLLSQPKIPPTVLGEPSNDVNLLNQYKTVKKILNALQKMYPNVQQFMVD